MMKPKRYVCTVCGFRGQRKECVLTHCVAKYAAPTHPLGRDTPVLVEPKEKDADVEEPPTDATELLRELVTSLAKTVKAPPEFVALGRRLAAALEPPSPNVDPACSFALELLPPRNELKRRLLDIFTFGVVPHIVWTHVHRHGTVRASSREGHLQTFGVHGWTTRPTPEVANAAMERMQTRLEKMWSALIRHDPGAAAVLRPSMHKFASKKTIFMAGEVFDMDTDVIASNDAVSKTTEELCKSLEEYAVVLQT